jgi:hypothetical protein
METQLYFWGPLVEEYQKELSLVEDYYRRTASVFDDMDKEVEKYGQELWDNYPGNEDTDPGDVAEWVQNQCLKRYEALGIMKSNHLLMSISMLHHLWEQRLITFTMREMKHYISFPKDEMSFEQVQIVFRLHEVDILNTEASKKLRELKFLVNIIKHGDGDSAKKLRKIRPDMFESEFAKETDSLKLYGSALFSAFALQVTEKDLHDYVEAAKAFWGEMPERAFSSTALVLEALNKAGKDLKCSVEDPKCCFRCKI